MNISVACGGVRVAALALCFAARASAQEDSAEDLAKELANPVGALISVPLQFNWDHDIGPNRGGRRFQLNIQPVVPISLNADWRVLSRTILPVVDQKIPFLGDGSQSGIGDITQSFFFSPTKPGASGIIWGAGAVILIPTGLDFIGADQWGLGPTGVVAKQKGPWTYGMLANHIWSVGGSGNQDISNTFLQPFVSYTTKDAWTFNVNTESTYDWEGEQWTVPINFTVSKLTHIGKQPVSLGVGARYWADGPATAPHGWGARFVVTFLFPE